MVELTDTFKEILHLLTNCYWRTYGIILASEDDLPNSTPRIKLAGSLTLKFLLAKRIF